MLTLDDDEVAKIAMLARIRVEKDDLAVYAGQLSGIFGLVEAMEVVNTADVEPMAHPQDLSQRLRVDKVTEVVDRERLQRGAPSTEEGLYLVPRVLG